jgi:hypothetical protein
MIKPFWERPGLSFNLSAFYYEQYARGFATNPLVIFRNNITDVRKTGVEAK